MVCMYIAILSHSVLLNMNICIAVFIIRSSMAHCAFLPCELDAAGHVVVFKRCNQFCFHVAPCENSN